MTEKEELLKQLKDNGYKDEFIDWLRPRYTNKKLRTLIENDKALNIIAEVARQSGLERKS